jgi:dTDP-4-dehydrorhamnose reductase
MSSTNPSLQGIPGKILILGASGFLGSHLFESLSERVETIGTYMNPHEKLSTKLHKLNATNYQELESFILKVAPTVIVNCVGLSDVEACEMRPEASWKLNAAIPIRVAGLAKSRSIKFIHISTDHFYSKINIPRSEIAPVIPINQYGYSKLHAEKSILTNNSDSLVLRTNFFGHSKNGKKSILDFAISTLESGQKINGFDDVVFSPVGIHEISKFLLSEVSGRATGVLNFASSRPLSKYEFMVLIAKARGFSESRVLRSEIRFSNLKVSRPSYLALDPGRLIKDLQFPVPKIENMLEKELAAVI